MSAESVLRTMERLGGSRMNFLHPDMTKLCHDLAMWSISPDPA